MSKFNQKKSDDQSFGYNNILGGVIMTTSKLLGFLFLFFAVVGFTGCGNENDCPSGEVAVEGVCYPECNSNSECQQLLRTGSWFCAPEGYCFPVSRSPSIRRSFRPERCGRSSGDDMYAFYGSLRLCR